MRRSGIRSMLLTGTMMAATSAVAVDWSEVVAVAAAFGNDAPDYTANVIGVAYVANW